MAWHHLRGHSVETPEWLKQVQDDYRKRKQERTEHYEKYVKGKKLVTCTACSGSGYYDNDGSPPCGCCDGTGKMREAP